jgi:uncharacterized RmlC-like cupin family protein
MLDRSERTGVNFGDPRFGVPLIPASAILVAHKRQNMGMAGSDPVLVIRPEDRVEGDPTPGMIREQAVLTDGMWAGLVRTEPHMVSGWHHHGDYETSIYVISGTLRMESGPGGSEVVEASPGDFLYVPREGIHRESNPGEDESQIVVVRVGGHGPTVINVETAANSQP